MAMLRGGSLGGRLSAWLAAQTFAGLALVSAIVYLFAAAELTARQDETLQYKRELVEHVFQEARRDHDREALLHKLDHSFPPSRDLALSLHTADRALLYASDAPAPVQPGKEIAFVLPHWDTGQGPVSARLRLDISPDQRFLRRLAQALGGASLLGALVVSLGGLLLVRRGLRPVSQLAAQIERLGADQPLARLDGSRQPLELQPLVEQFNALLARLARSREQLEGFNADVAHELRTPLATLITSIEVALREPGLSESSADLLGSNLEDLRRMAGIIGDMLFLAQASGGAAARREPVASLAALAGDVAEYHEAALAEAGLTLLVIGDAAGRFDAPLLKRALSNLLGNATRYARPASAIELSIARKSGGGVQLTLSNESAAAIPPEHLPRLFDRFYRIDPARAQAAEGSNHGLGLSIVAAIARMHGGEPFAESQAGSTRIGFTLAGG